MVGLAFDLKLEYLFTKKGAIAIKVQVVIPFNVFGNDEEICYLIKEYLCSKSNGFNCNFENWKFDKL